MPDEQMILNPGDLPAEELIRLHRELEGDPASGSHREAWDRWQQWLVVLRATADSDQAARAERIAAYIAATFQPPSDEQRRAAALGIVTGGAGAAAYELEQAGQAGAAATGPTAAEPAAPASTSAGSQAPGATATPAAGTRTGRPVSSATAGTARSPLRFARAVFTGPHRTIVIFSAAAAVTAAVVVGAVALASPSSSSSNRAAGTTVGSGTTAVAGGSAGAYTCTGAETKLFDNYNGDGVSGGGTAPSLSTGGDAYCVIAIDTYHWNDGAGAPPGYLSLVSSSGTVGPFEASGTSGQGNAPDVNWTVSLGTTPRPVVIKGRYTCESTDPSSWSQDSASGGAGFCEVWVTKAEPSR